MSDTENLKKQIKEVRHYLGEAMLSVGMVFSIAAFLGAMAFGAGFWMTIFLIFVSFWIGAILTAVMYP